MIDLRILDAPGQREQLWPLSVEAYRTLGESGLIPENTELLRGFVFRKTPKSPFHRAILQRLLRRINAVLQQDKFWLQSEQPITCGDSEPEPDLAVCARVERAARPSFSAARRKHSSRSEPHLAATPLS